MFQYIMTRCAPSYIKKLFRAKQRVHNTYLTSKPNHSNILTRSKLFKSLTEWAFVICDRNGTNKIEKEELYTGLLLVHIALGKFAGPAACYPPSRETVDKLFDASDRDHSGSLNQKEFEEILGICCAQIFSRVLVYYAIIILLLPYIAIAIVYFMAAVFHLMGWSLSLYLSWLSEISLVTWIAWIANVVTVGDIAEKIVSLGLFTFALPKLFDLIDAKSNRAAAAKRNTKSQVVSPLVSELGEFTNAAPCATELMVRDNFKAENEIIHSNSGSNHISNSRKLQDRTERLKSDQHSDLSDYESNVEIENGLYAVYKTPSTSRQVNNELLVQNADIPNNRRSSRASGSGLHTTSPRLRRSPLPVQFNVFSC